LPRIAYRKLSELVIEMIRNNGQLLDEKPTTAGSSAADEVNTLPSRGTRLFPQGRARATP
jgi:hypothetical protein